MVEIAYVIPWIERADADFASARYLAKNMHPVPTGIVCFHCQQAAEKYLKAFLVYNDQEPQKTHELSEIIKQCCKFNTDFSVLNLKSKFLIPFAVGTRYPSGIDPDENDMKIALTYAEDIIKFTRSKIPDLPEIEMDIN